MNGGASRRSIDWQHGAIVQTQRVQRAVTIALYIGTTISRIGEMLLGRISNMRVSIFGRRVFNWGSITSS